MTRARQIKDISDLQELLKFLESKTLFNSNYTTLRSIAPSMVANDAINAHRANGAGMNKLKSMEGKILQNLLPKKVQIVTHTIRRQSPVEVKDILEQVFISLLI